MLKFLKTIPILVFLVAGFATAGGIIAVKYALDPTNTAPISSTAGLPLSVNGEPLKGLTVTVFDFADGGNDEEFIWLGDLKAWVLKPELRYPDGGGGWARAPQFDLGVDAGTSAGAPIASNNVSGLSYVLPFTPATTQGLQTGQFPALTGGRIYYQSVNLKGHDAGTARHNIFLEGRY